MAQPSLTIEHFPRKTNILIWKKPLTIIPGVNLVIASSSWTVLYRWTPLEACVLFLRAMLIPKVMLAIENLALRQQPFDSAKIV